MSIAMKVLGKKKEKPNDGHSYRTADITSMDIFYTARFFSNEANSFSSDFILASAQKNIGQRQHAAIKLIELANQ